MTSFASAKGPSVTLGLPPANVTRAPIEGGWRPSSASSTPAFRKDSLYFIIASTALASGMAPGAAFSYPLGIISIMNRMVTTPFGFCFGAEQPDGLGRKPSLYRHDERGSPRSTRRGNFFS